MSPWPKDELRNIAYLCAMISARAREARVIIASRHSGDRGMVGRRVRCGMAGLVLVIGQIGSSASAQARPGTGPISAMQPNDWSVEVVSDALSYPWDLARVGDRLLITETAGRIVVIERGKLQRFALETSEPIVQEGGGGLLGMALQGDFATSGVAYFYHAYRSRNGLMNRIIQARFDGRAWHETHELLRGIPGHRLYNGGRLAFGPDGHLYATTGWAEDGRLPQDLGSLAGKVLRLTREGKLPSGNPFPGSYVYSYGHRNPQGLAWNAQGELLVSEHGQSGHDEINLIRPGANYGWPQVSGDERRPGMQPPLLQSGGNTWAPSGIAFAGNELLMTALAARGLFVVDLPGRALKPVFSSGDRLRAVLPVGREIYVITTNRSPRADGPANGDRLLRLTPSS